MEIKINEQKKQMAVGYRFNTTKMKLAKGMNDFINDLKYYIAENNGEIVGAPFVIYHNMDKNLDVTIGVAVNNSIPTNDKFKIIEINGGLAIEAIHIGSYIWLNRVYKKMTKYMENNNIEPSYLAYEYYYNSPKEVKTKDLKTKIVLYIK